MSLPSFDHLYEFVKGAIEDLEAVANEELWVRDYLDQHVYGIAREQHHDPGKGFYTVKWMLTIAYGGPTAVLILPDAVIEASWESDSIRVQLEGDAKGGAMRVMGFLDEVWRGCHISLPTPEELHHLQKDYLTAKVTYDYIRERVIHRARKEANPDEYGNEAFVARILELEEEYHLDKIKEDYQYAKRQLLLAVRGLFRRYYSDDPDIEKVLQGIDYILQGNPIAIADEDKILDMAARIRHPEEG